MIHLPLGWSSWLVVYISTLGHKLRTLNLGFTAVSDVAALGNCMDLQSLCLRCIDDFRALGNCTLLQKLHLSICIYVNDISELGDCIHVLFDPLHRRARH